MDIQLKGKWKSLSAVFCILSLLWIRASAGDTWSDAANATITVDGTKYLFETDERFLSFTLDCLLLRLTPRWGELNFRNPRVFTLARGLKPAYVRFGGTDADRVQFKTYSSDDALKFVQYGKLSKFNTVTDKVMGGNFQNKMSAKLEDEVVVPIYPEDVDDLRMMAEAADGPLIFCLNICLRNGTQWDPTNAVEMINYIIGTSPGPTVENIGFELGNEYPYLSLKPTMDQWGKDYILLRQTLDSLPAMKGAFIEGPAVGGVNVTTTNHWVPVVTEFVKIHKDISAKALTVHQYYFNGPHSTVEEFFDLKFFTRLTELLRMVNKVMVDAGGEGLPLWIGEGADANIGGGPGRTDRFMSGFLWMDKLGTAAKNGVTMVARQDFFGRDYGLVNTSLDPNPDYWVSFIFKRLVGQRVLNITQPASFPNTTRLYAHCTSKQYYSYPPGSVTLFGMNLLDAPSPLLKFSAGVGSVMDVFSLTPPAGDVASSKVLVNGQPIELVDDHTLPELNPVLVKVLDGFVVAGRSMFFAVVKDASLTVCNDQ